MAVPKHKISKARRGHRKSQWKLVPLNLVACPQCHVLKLPHRVCPECGYYKGEQVVAIKERKAAR
jgi:large subunit ribosomal protein L32